LSIRLLEAVNARTEPAASPTSSLAAPAETGTSATNDTVAGADSAASWLRRAGAVLRQLFIAPSPARPSVMRPDGVENPDADPVRPFNPVLYALQKLGPLGGLHQGDYWPVVQRAFDKGWWVQAYLLVHIAAGWVLSAIFAAGFFGLFKRELD
jgi:hypothetical protein